MTSPKTQGDGDLGTRHSASAMTAAEEVEELRRKPPGIDPTAERIRSDAYIDATIHPTATVCENVSIGPGARIGARAVIGPGSTIGPLCSVQDDACLGSDVRLEHETVVGAGVVVHRGAQLDERVHIVGNEHNEPSKRIAAVIGEHSEIGKNTRIIEATVGAGVRMADGCYIARQSTVGAGAELGPSAQVGFRGEVGEGATLGRKAYVGNHQTLASGAALADHEHLEAARDPETPNREHQVVRGANRPTGGGRLTAATSRNTAAPATR